MLYYCFWLLLPFLCIPSLPWLATVWTCPLELGEGHECWNLIYSLQKRKGGQIVFCAQEPLRPAQFQQGKGRGDIGMFRESKLFWGFPDGSDGKDSACIAGDPGLIPGWGESPWRRKWQPTLVSLPRKSSGQRSLAGYSPWGFKELDTTGWLMLSLSFQVSVRKHLGP